MSEVKELGNKDGCTCAQCCNACTRKPGWFAPGEAEKAAEFLGLPMKQFFDQYLMVDWFERDTSEGVDHDLFLLSPATVGNAGDMAPGDPRGRCVFYKDNRCSIHPVKPIECRQYLHDQTAEVYGPNKKANVKNWLADETNQRAQIVELLGREPETEEYDGGGLMGIFGVNWGSYGDWDHGDND